jgi:hypothetical protein
VGDCHGSPVQLTGELTQTKAVQSLASPDHFAVLPPVVLRSGGQREPHAGAMGEIADRFPKPQSEVLVRKSMTLPCLPQPKQWKNRFSTFTVNDDILSEWNGQQARYSLPARASLTYRPMISAMSVPSINSASHRGEASARGLRREAPATRTRCTTARRFLSVSQTLDHARSDMSSFGNFS